jgi:hypothetical protein
MTKDTLRNEVDLEKILASLVDKNGVCKTCGQDHSFEPTFRVTNTSIDVMPQDKKSVTIVEVKI